MCMSASYDDACVTRTAARPAGTLCCVMLITSSSVSPRTILEAGHWPRLLVWGYSQQWQHIAGSVGGLIDFLKTKNHPRIRLASIMSWLSLDIPSAPANVQLERLEDQQWEAGRWYEDAGHGVISCNTPVVLHWTYNQHHLEQKTEKNNKTRSFRGLFGKMSLKRENIGCT